ncbi:oxidoreductase [Paenibacillus pectinilyticus]|uniref:Oxidoreductase n=1 Tax=Paenibacillus pectinilyticus TaxID=512399 RepID=A0A1C1A398_9BACL|nr:Gfo/Idh/MocA family oxidoreductase [Paenibacillus pectinilyticus]OCT15032.1 oxidoreductase [Paenibacillus pectinilyticus]
MTSLKVAVIGTGGIFKAFYWPLIQENKEIKLQALCDINPSKAQAYADEAEVPVYGDFYELLEQQKEIDAIFICTPNLYHSEYAIAALNAGIHVFSEKPDAVSVAEALKMKEAAERNGRHLMVMRNNRYRPEAKWLKQVSQSGYFGELYAGRCGWIRRRGIPGKGGWFTTKELSGGGPLIDLGVHMIDLAVWIMGNPKPVTVSGATYCKFANSELADSVHSQFGESQSEGHFDVEDLANGYIRFDNGATLQIEFSWASNIEQERSFVELRGTQAGFSLDGNELKVFSELQGALTNTQPLLPPGKGGHPANLEHFIDVLLRETAPDFTPSQGVDMIKILEAIYESARLGREVTL